MQKMIYRKKGRDEITCQYLAESFLKIDQFIIHVFKTFYFRYVNVTCQELLSDWSIYLTV
jgi:hypothetical protein